MSRYIDKDKLIESLNYFAPEYYNALINDLIVKQPEADVVEVNDVLIVSMYDGGYDCSMLVSGKLTTKYDNSVDDELHRVWEAFCYPMNECKALQIMNKHNVSKVILCEDGCIGLFEKRGNELCKML